MYRSVLAGALVCAAAISTSANAITAAPTITVTPSLAPNAFGSPSYNTYVSNAVAALLNNQTSYGDPNSPSYYQATSNVNARQGIVTGFPSWLGSADPAAVYGPAYANELGNRMSFGLKINGNGQQFSISQLSFASMSSDPDNAFEYAIAAGGYNYNAGYVGVLAGPDGILFDSDDTFVTSGPNTQLVDGLVGRGTGLSFAAYCDACTTAEQQAAIEDTASYFTTDTTFTGAYTLDGVTGSGTFNIAAVPEPGTWAMMIGGFGLVGGAMRRRRVSATLAHA